MANFIHALRWSPGGWNDENKQLIGTLMSRYAHLMLDVLLPFYAEQSREHKCDFRYFQPYVMITANCWRYLPNSARWTEVMVEHGRRVMQYVDLQGPISTGCHNMTVTYVYPLSVITALQRNPYGRLTESDAARLDELFAEMEQHRLPGMRGFGKLGRLWLQQELGRLSPEQTREGSRAILDYAKRAMENPGEFVPDVEPSNRVLSNNRDIRPPYAEVDDWIWSFHPLARTSLDGKSYQQFEERLESKRHYRNHVTPDINALEYLPDRRALLHGNQESLWYFQLPDEPDPPPGRGAKPGVGKT